MTRIFFEPQRREGREGGFGWFILILEEKIRIKIPNRWREIEESGG